MSKNFKIIIFTLLCCLFNIASYAAANDVKTIQQLIMRKDYVHAVEFSKKAIENGFADKATLLFYHGEALFYNGDYRDAIDTFYELVSKHSKSKYIKKALVRTADAYYVMQDYEQAKKTYDLFLTKFKDAEFQSYVYLKLIYCSEKLGFWEDKNKYLYVLKTRFSSSLEATMIPALEKRGYFYLVQLGAFGSKVNALALFKRVKRDGFDAAIVKDGLNGMTLYKVVAGKFKTRKNADVLVAKLVEKGYPAKRFP